MDMLIALVVAVFWLSVIALPVYVMHRLRASTREIDQTPDDLRRAGDGLDDRGGGGAGLGPLWPPR